jgi:hypothetical protein
MPRAVAAADRFRCVAGSFGQEVGTYEKIGSPVWFRRIDFLPLLAQSPRVLEVTPYPNKRYVGQAVQEGQNFTVFFRNLDFHVHSGEHDASGWTVEMPVSSWDSFA